MTYKEIDFNQLYVKQKQSSTFKMKNQNDWNNKAQSMNQRVHKSIYNEALISKIDFTQCESFLDVGCGVGNIAINVAQKVSKVFALDYSTEMLNLLKQTMAEKKLSNITPIKASWEEDWRDIPKADIVLASRSLEVANMEEALEKITAKAKKRVYVTYKVGGSFLDAKILSCLNKEIFEKPDYILLVNILYRMGINPTLQYIKSEGRKAQYETKESFIQSVEWSLGSLSDEDKEKLDGYYERLGEKKEGLGEPYNHWALLSWEVKA